MAYEIIHGKFSDTFRITDRDDDSATFGRLESGEIILRAQRDHPEVLVDPADLLALTEWALGDQLLTAREAEATIRATAGA